MRTKTKIAKINFFQNSENCLKIYNNLKRVYSTQKRLDHGKNSEMGAF